MTKEEILDQKIILDYNKDIVRIANELACGDNFLSEELLSEMYISVLKSKSDNKVVKLVVAKQKAIEYLRLRAQVIEKHGPIFPSYSWHFCSKFMNI